MPMPAMPWFLRGTLLAIVVCSGCYAPLHSVGVPASSLPDHFRMPQRTAGPPLNFASLAIPAQTDYLLGPGDLLEITVHGLFPGESTIPLRCQVMGTGEIHLPIVGAIKVEGRNLVDAQIAIAAAYADDILKQPRVNVFLVEKSATTVLVLGEVRNPGAYRLPKYENDVAHALAMAGGLSENAGLQLEIHRRHAPPGPDGPKVPPLGANWEEIAPPPVVCGPDQWSGYGMEIIRIPLRGIPEQPLGEAGATLQAGDVLVVPSRRHEVFFVVGKLSSNNAVRFSLGLAERELGGGFVLPRDREIDVVTAVCMAGYIDPIDSPTTVTVHRVGLDGRPMLIHVDLIKARTDFRETVLVEPGDIIYLNPDAAWWTRRTFDRIIPSLFSLSYRKLIGLGSTGSD